MTERNFPFDAENIDRLYQAIDWQATALMFSDNGVLFNWDNDMEVRTTTPNQLKVQVSTGAMINEGIFFQVYDEAKEITIPANTDAFPRIDSIVVQHDKQRRTMAIVRKEGLSSNNPEPPELVNDQDFRESSLAWVRVESGANKITPDKITDRRKIHPDQGDSVPVGMYSVLGLSVENNPQHNLLLGTLRMGENMITRVNELGFADRAEDNNVIKIVPRQLDACVEIIRVNLTTRVETCMMRIETDSIAGANRLAGLSNVDTVTVGTSDEASYIGTGSDGVRLLFDNLGYTKVSRDAVTMFFDDDANGTAEATHIFYATGAKVAGSIRLDGKRWGMSPTDSPRSLISDLMQGYDVDGTQTIYLNRKFLKTLHEYAVFPSNPNITVQSKSAESFTVQGKGKTDFKVIGKRYDKRNQYFERLYRDRG